MRPGEKKSNDVSVDLLSKLLSGVEDSDEGQIVKRKLRELGIRVTADKSTLEQIGMSAKDFVPFEVGARQTIEWFMENQGKTWNDPQS